MQAEPVNSFKTIPPNNFLAPLPARGGQIATKSGSLRSTIVRWRSSEDFKRTSFDEIVSGNLTQLSNVDCNLARTQTGKIIAKGCYLDTVASKHVELIDCEGKIVKASSGSAIVVNSEKNPTTAFEKIEAKVLITLKKIRVTQTVQCTEGKVLAKDCVLNNVTARDGIKFKNVAVHNCEARSGEIKYICKKKRLTSHNLFAANKIFLKNVNVKEKVESKTSSLKANICKLNEVHAVGKISLICTSAEKVFLTIVNGEPGLVQLHDSTINSDLIIEYKDSITPVNYLTEGELSIYSSEKHFNITCGDMLNLEASLSSLNKDIFAEGTKGKINNKNYVFTKGKFVLLASSEENLLQKDAILVRITGGTIIENIIFKGFEDQIKYELDSLLLGNIEFID